MKRARVIYNPTSGREVFKKELPEVLEKLEKAGYEASTHATTGAGDATRAALIAVERKYDLVIACGGDGTLFEVINGLAEQEYRPKLGVIPVGTTNDFARALHVNVDIQSAIDIICEGHSMPVDIGKVNDGYFINIAGGGRITELTYEVPSKMKTMLGQLAYVVKGIEILPSIKPSHMRIEYDGQVFDDKAMMFLIANTNSVGGFEKLAPDASLHDGMFTLLILKKCSMLEFIRVVRMAIFGDHTKSKKVIYAKANHIKVSSELPLHLNLDGEYGGKMPAIFTNLPSHIDVFIPKAWKDMQDFDLGSVKKV